MAKITLIGLSNYNDHLFDELILPEGIDKETLINNILIKGGDFEVLYADAGFMQKAIGVWAMKWQATFKKWLAGINVEYNPIENYDRYEEWNDTAHNTNNVGANDTTDANGSGDNVDSRSSYDNADYTPHNRTDSSNRSHSESKSHSDAEGWNTNDHTAHIHGNIGVTTAAQMLEGHYDIAAWNLYEHITDLFLHEFIIPLY